MTEESPATFGDLLREFRLAAGLSQELLAERAHMSMGGISLLERGLRRSPHRETIGLLAVGLELSPEDRSRLEAAAWRPAQPRSRKPAPGEALPSHNLPMELTSFVGRAAEIAEIAGLLKTRHLVTLVGTGGVGKTRTAIHAAHELLASRCESTWFVDLSTISEPSTSVAVEIARTLGLEESANQPAIETLVSHFARNASVLVLDNCEHVISEAADVVSHIVRAGLPVRFLATSREPLKVEGEQVYRLPSLLQSEAIELFAQRAAAVQHRFTLTDDNRSTVATICDRLDGIPLAIELAAARISVFPLKTLYEKLDRRFATLSSASQRGSPRQRTMRALVDWSYDLLTEREQEIFEHLSVFAGGFTPDAAFQVCGNGEISEPEMFDILASLVDKSLLITTVDAQEPRFTLLESLREYAREKLDLRGTFGQIAHRHARAYYQIARYLEERSDAPFPTELIAELDNWRAALDWALNAGGDSELGMRLASALRTMWYRIAPLDGRYWLQTALDRVDERTPIRVLAQLEYAQANLSQRFSETQLALELGTRALEHFRQLRDARAIAQTQRVVGFALISLGRIDEAEPVLNATLETARQIGFRWLAAAALESLGLCYAYKHVFDEAQRRLSEAIAIYKDIGDSSIVASATLNLAEVTFAAGDASGALQLAEQGIAAFSGLDHARLPALNNLAAYLIALSRYEEARSRALEALELASRLRLHNAFSWSLQHLAAVALFQPLDANTNRRAVDAARVLGFVDSKLITLGAMREHTEQQEYDRAISALQSELDAQAVSAAMAAGAAMTEEQVFTIANSLN